MFVWNPLGFGQHLPPPIFQTGFDPQHRQVFRIKVEVLIGRTARKQEIRLGVTFGPCTPFMADAQRRQCIFDVVFEGQPHAAFAAVLDGQ